MESLLKKQADEIIHSDEWKEKLVINSIGVAGEMYLVDTPFVDSMNDCIQLWIDRRSGDVVCDDGYIAYDLLNITCSLIIIRLDTRYFSDGRKAPPNHRKMLSFLPNSPLCNIFTLNYGIIML